MPNFVPLLAAEPAPALSQAASSAFAGRPGLAGDRALFRHPAGRGLVGRPQEQGHRRRLLPGRPQPGLVGHRRLDLRLQHRLGAHRRAWPARAPRTAWPWPITSCTPGACWCWPGCSCRSTPARWSSPCRSSSNGGSRTGSRYVLSIVSLITFIVSKIAVGIFAGGVVFATLLPEVHLNVGRRRDRQLLDRLGAGDRADRPLHHAGRHARRGLQRRRAGRRAHRRLGRC